MNSTSAEEVAGLLCEHGWTAAKGTAIASRNFETAVGVKTAYAYFYGFREGSEFATLTGDYISEGRNVLSSCHVLVPRTADKSKVAELVASFAAQAEVAVRQSYAAHLLKMC